MRRAVERHPIGERILAITGRMLRAAGLAPRPEQCPRKLVTRAVACPPVVQNSVMPNLAGIER